MVEGGEEPREPIRSEFNRSIMTDFQGAKITSDTGFLLLREIERFGILGPLGRELEDTRSWVHGKHSQLQMVRQRTDVDSPGDNGYMDLSRSLLSGTRL